MIVGVSSQNFRTITGHAGKGRRFLIYRIGEDGSIEALEQLDLPKELAMHGFAGGEHPLDQLDVLITAGCGPGFISKMAARGVRVIPTGESDPRRAVERLARNEPMPPPSSE